MVVAAFALGAVAVAGCGGSDEEPAAKARDSRNPPSKARVVMTKTGYHPKHVRILVGGQVTWVNLDKSAPHTAGTDDLGKSLTDTNEFDTHTLTWEEPYTITFHNPE